MKVRLVEKSLKRKVGRVIEVNVAAQYRTAGTKRPISMAKAPRRPIHDRDVVVPGAVAIADEEDDTAFGAILWREPELVKPVGASPWKDASMVGSSVGEHAAC